MKAPSIRLDAAAVILGLVSVAPAFGEPFRLDRKFDLAAGDRFVLVSEVGRVELRGVAGQQASIVVTSDRTDLATRYDFRFEQGAGRLRMVAERKDKGLLSWLARSGRTWATCASRSRSRALRPSSSTARAGASTSRRSTRR